MRKVIHALPALLLLGCNGGKPTLQELDPARYAASPYCWEKDRRTLEAFAIFDPAGDEGYVPSFISFKCIPSDQVFKDSGAYLTNLSAFRVEKSSSNLTKFGFSSNVLLSNDPVELSIPGESQRVYFIRAKFRREGSRKYIDEFEVVTDTKLTVGEFFRLTEGQLHDLGEKLALP